MKQRSNNWPKRVGTFLNNYRAVFFLAAAILLSSSAFSQVDTNKVVQYINAFGYRYKNIGIDSSFRIPADTFKLSFRDTAALAIKGKVLYRWDKTKWQPVAAKINDTTFIINGDTVRSGGGSGGGGAVNLDSLRDATSFTIVNPTGTDAVILGATLTKAGAMTASMRYSLDSAITKIVVLNDSVKAYYNSKGQIVSTDTGKAFDFVLPLKVVGQSARIDYDTNSIVIINNKLAAKVTTVKNISELRSLPSYDTAYVYRLVQNKVIGDFYYVPGCSDADDSAMSIAVTGGCLKRYTAGIVRPEYFGAINNDLLDDTYSMQKMWNWIGANSGVDKREEYTVVFTGKYFQSATINLPKIIYSQGGWPTIRVVGYGATIILSGNITGMKRVPVDMSEASSIINNSRWTIEGITFIGDLTTGQKAIEMGALYSANIHDNYFSSLDTAVVIRFILGSVVMNNQFIQNKTTAFIGSSGAGAWSGADDANSAFNANYITRNRIFCSNGSYAGLMLEAMDGTDINNLIIEGYKPRYSFYSNSQGSSVVNGNHLSKVWFEANGGVYTYNTSMRLRVNGIFTISDIQNDTQDTLIDWTGTTAGANISLDNVEYWNFAGGTYFKGAPASGMVFNIGRVYGTATENLFTASKYLDGIPADVFSLYPYQTSGGGMGIASNSQISLKPNFNAADNVKLINVVGNVKPSVNNTYDLGSGSLKWNFVYGNKLLAGLTSDDGSGSKLQSGGAISLADGSQIFEPSGLSFLKVSTANGTEIGYGSGGTLGKVQINPNLDYIYGGTTKFRVYSGGNVRMGATISNHGEVLQVDGTSWFNGTVQIVDGSQGLNKVLTSDASGLASWQTPSGGSGITGLTTNTIPKATSGTSIGNSTITDNASLITLGLPTNVTGALKPSTDNTYTLGSFANRWSELYVKAKGYFNLAADDGSGAIVQIGGSASLSDGSSFREPSNTSSFIVSTGVGTQVKYGLGNLQVNPHVSYVYNSVEVGRWYSNGNLRLGSISDNGDKLQVDGTSWLNGRVKINFTNLAASPSYLIAKQSDSGLAEIALPGGTTSFLAGNGTFVTPSAGSNIYTADGTLSGNRVVTLSTLDLSFTQASTGRFKVNGLYAAVTPLKLITQQSDSSFSGLAFPGGTTNYLREDGTFAAPPGIGLSGLSNNVVMKATSGTTIGSSTASDDGTNFIFSAGFAVASTQTITSGTSSTIGNGVYRYEFDPAAVIATYTVTMPSAPVDGQKLMIRTGKTIAVGQPTITTLTVLPNSGQSIFGAITLTTLNCGDVVEYEYELSNTTWFRTK